MKRYLCQTNPELRPSSCPVCEFFLWLGGQSLEIVTTYSVTFLGRDGLCTKKVISLGFHVKRTGAGEREQRKEKVFFLCY